MTKRPTFPGFQVPKLLQQPDKYAVFDIRNVTHFERTQFLWSGIYPLETTNKYRILLHHFLLFLVAAFSLILTTSMVVALIVGVENLNEIADILYYLITQIAYICQLINFVVRRPKLLKIERHLKNDLLYKYYAIFGHECLDSIVNQCWAMGLSGRSAATCLFFFYVVSPFVVEDKLLPFAGWMPVSKEDYWVIIYLLQLSSFVVSCCTNAALEIIACYYICIGVGNLRLLKKFLSNIDYMKKGNEIGKNQDISVIREDNDENIPTLPANTLEEAVILHKHCLDLIIMVEDMFSAGIFVQFMASVITICMTLFQMLFVTPGSMDFYLLSSYFFCMLFQVVIYCYFGNEIINESQGINDACYMSNWYEAEPRYKKVLILIMERSKRPIFLTAGKIFVLSLTTLVLITKTSYSYFSVLRQVYADA